MYARGKSDSRIVPKKLPNKEAVNASAEAVEGRQLTKGNTLQTARPRTQSREGLSIGLRRVREAARRNRRARLTALLHHITPELLRASFLTLKRQAAPGVDGVTWQQYEEGLEDRVMGLHEQVHRGAYRAQPSKRAYIAKPDGRLRSLGIAALEDKIVQQAVVTILNQIYEVDFVGFSYGFRPGRNQHQALDALWVGLMGRVSWVLDADIQGFFDAIDHGWMLKFLEHRIGDRRLLRLVRKWLRAGVSEDGGWTKTTRGTPQGAVISPLLANVYLHYAFDLWANHWRKHQARGDVIIVRYADDFIVGFQYRGDAERFLCALRRRMERFGLVLHPKKTRLIEFGRFAAQNRRQRGERKPETFDFLGFTHICGTKYRKEGFIVRRLTSTRRFRAKLKEIRRTLMYGRHRPVPELGRWLRLVVQGYFNYHAIPGNVAALNAFRWQVARAWLRALRRRSQRHRMPWKRFYGLVSRWLPKPRILHEYPNARFFAMHPR
jgi:group II intron reverse transcriptase/maturase